MPVGSPSARALVQEVESKIDFTVIPGISAIESKLDQLDLAHVDEMLSAIESKLDNTIIVDIDDIQTMLSVIESKIDFTVITGISAIESKLDFAHPDIQTMLSAIESKIEGTTGIMQAISAVESKLDQWNLADVDEMLSAIESKIEGTTGIMQAISAVESKLDQWNLADVDDMLSAIESKIEGTTGIMAAISVVDLEVSLIESKLDFALPDVQTMLSAIESKIEGTTGIMQAISAVESKLDFAHPDIQTMLSAIESKIDKTLITDLSAIESKLDLNLPSILSNLVEAQLRAFRRTYAFVSTNEQVANAAEVSLAAPAVVTVNFPTGATLLEAKVVASLKANNQTAAEHNIGVTLQRNVAAGGWVDIRDFTANPPLTLPEVDATGDALTLVETLTITTTQTVQFRWQVDSDNAGAVNYTQVFVLSVEYDFQ